VKWRSSQHASWKRFRPRAAAPAATRCTSCYGKLIAKRGYPARGRAGLPGDKWKATQLIVIRRPAVDASVMTCRRFPPPWTIEEANNDLLYRQKRKRLCGVVTFILRTSPGGARPPIARPRTRHGALLPALPDCPSCCAQIRRTQMCLSKGDEARGGFAALGRTRVRGQRSRLKNANGDYRVPVGLTTPHF
jgi:hypothetical protein